MTERALQSNGQSDLPLILIIDDEPAIAESLSYSLKAAGFAALSASSLSEASRLIEHHSEAIQLVILDLILPDGHGFDWLRSLRTTSLLPVVILSSHDDEVEHIVGLELGADDFIDKPFSPREVVARIRAVLRRSATSSSLNSRVHPHPTPALHDHRGAVVIDYDQHRIFVDRGLLELSQLEFALFDALFNAAGRVLSRTELLKLVWGVNVSVSERTVDVHITSLRKKWAEQSTEPLIETVRGIGYRLADGAPPLQTRGRKTT